MRKKCRDCKYGVHPEWAVMLPFFLVCEHPKAISGRIDVERTLKGDYCGPEGKWWATKERV